MQNKLFLATLLLSLMALPACGERPTNPAVTSFVSFGDFGTGGLDQWLVALEVDDYCKKNECEFILSLGDNFYEEGVQSTEDTQWTKKFSRMYGLLNLPFYAILGNHDTQGSVQAQILRTEKDPLWNMPAEYYSLSFPEGTKKPNVDIFVINSNNFTEEQATWLRRSLTASAASWKLLALHHPVVSNGPHGDDSAGIGEQLLPIICGRVDLILAGHEHFFAHLYDKQRSCTINQLILGTGGASLFAPDTADPRVQSTGSFFGFGWFEISREKLLFRMIREDENEFYTAEWRKGELK